MKCSFFWGGGRGWGWGNNYFNFHLWQRGGGGGVVVVLPVAGSSKHHHYAGYIGECRISVGLNWGGGGTLYFKMTDFWEHQKNNFV